MPRQIIVAIDGDTVLLPDAIEHLVTHFAIHGWSGRR